MNIQIKDTLYFDDEEFTVIEVSESVRYLHDRHGVTVNVSTVVIKNKQGFTRTITKETEQ